MKKLGTIIPIIGWLLAIALGGFYWFAPAWLWVDGATIAISDGTAGGASPAVTLEVAYEKTILVHWTRILHKESDTAEWLACDIESAEMGYSGQQTVKTTLNQLFEDKPCSRDLAPGDYYVEALLEWDDGSHRNLPIESNVFTINPAPARRPAPVPQAPAVAAETPRPHYHRHTPGPALPWPLSIFVNHR